MIFPDGDLIHRGGKAFNEISENTVISAAESLKHSSGIEIDLQITADGHVVVTHSGDTRKQNFQDFFSNDQNAGRATLECFLDWFNDEPNLQNKILYLDIKTKQIDPFELMQMIGSRNKLAGRIIIGAGSRVDELPRVGKEYMKRLFIARQILGLDRMTREDGSFITYHDGNRLEPAVVLCHQIPDPVFILDVLRNIFKVPINPSENVSAEALGLDFSKGYFRKINKIHTQDSTRGVSFTLQNELINLLTKKNIDISKLQFYPDRIAKELKHFFYPEDFKYEVFDFGGFIDKHAPALSYLIHRASSIVRRPAVWYQKKRIATFILGTRANGHEIVTGATDNTQSINSFEKLGAKFVMTNEGRQTDMSNENSEIPLPDKSLYRNVDKNESKKRKPPKLEFLELLDAIADSNFDANNIPLRIQYLLMVYLGKAVYYEES